jgi:histidine triad (HIT) family protein
MSEKCIFCEIASGRIPSIRVYEDSDFIAFMDINPLSEGHLLLVTRSHFPKTTDVPEAVLARALPVAAKLARAAITATGREDYNLIVNNGPLSGQLVFHWHMHIIPRGSKGELPLKAGEPADLTKLPFVAERVRQNLDQG